MQVLLTRFLLCMLFQVGIVNTGACPGCFGTFVSVLSPKNRVRQSVNKSAASAASLDYVKFQAVIKSAASAASLRGGRASSRLVHGFFGELLAALAAKK